jgi:hypothetical protein
MLAIKALFCAVALGIDETFLYSIAIFVRSVHSEPKLDTVQWFLSVYLLIRFLSEMHIQDLHCTGDTHGIPELSGVVQNVPDFQNDSILNRQIIQTRACRSGSGQ